MLVEVSLDLLKEGDVVYYYCGNMESFTNRPSPDLGNYPNYRKGIYTSKCSEGVTGVRSKWKSPNSDRYSECFFAIEHLDGNICMELDYLRNKKINILCG